MTLKRNRAIRVILNSKREILCRKTSLPICSPVLMMACIILGFKDLHISLVPLQRPPGGSIFLSRMIGEFGFKVNL